MSESARRTGTAIRGRPSASSTTVTVTVEFAVPDDLTGSDESLLPRALRWLADEASAGLPTVLPVQVTVARAIDGYARHSDRPPIAAGLVLRAREAPSAVHGDRYELDGDLLGIYPGSRTVRRDGKRLELTRLEFDLLLHLAEHPRRVFTREQLLKAVWGDEVAGPRTVDVHVQRLRAKVGDERPLVATVHGVGYRLADGAPVTVIADR